MEKLAMGMVRRFPRCWGKGLMPAGITQSITDMCQKFGLPVDYENWDVDKLYQALTLMTRKAWQIPWNWSWCQSLSATIHPVSSGRDERLLGKIGRAYEIFNCRRITRPSSDGYHWRNSSWLPLTAEDINEDLKRQGGYGRGGRMKIERTRLSLLRGSSWGRRQGPHYHGCHQ